MRAANIKPKRTGASREVPKEATEEKVTCKRRKRRKRKNKIMQVKQMKKFPLSNGE